MIVYWIKKKQTKFWGTTLWRFPRDHSQVSLKNGHHISVVRLRSLEEKNHWTPHWTGCLQHMAIACEYNMIHMMYYPVTGSLESLESLISDAPRIFDAAFCGCFPIQSWDVWNIFTQGQASPEDLKHEDLITWSLLKHLKTSANTTYPLVDVYITDGKDPPIFRSKINYFYGPFSVAMFVYQRASLLLVHHKPSPGFFLMSHPLGPLPTWLAMLLDHPAHYWDICG